MLGDRNSVKKSYRYLLIETFSQFSGLKTNISKCEIPGVGLLKGTIEAVCGLKLVGLTVDSIKILDVQFSYNKEAQIRKKILSQLEIYKRFFVFESKESFIRRENTYF